MASQSSTGNAERKPLSITVSRGATSKVQAKPSRLSTARKPTGSRADDTLQEVLNRLPHEAERCVDVETSGLDWRHNAIVGYVLSFGPRPDDSYYIPFRHAGTANVGGRPGLTSATGWDGKVLPGEAELIKALDQPDTVIFGHNMAFDLRFLSRVGFGFQPQVEDTQINEPLIDELIGSYSLEACARRHGVEEKKKKAIVTYLRERFPDIKSDREAMGHYWRLSGDDRDGVEYATGDGTTTWQLRDAQMKVIRRVDTFNGKPVPTLERVHKVESRLIRVLARMMTRGVKVDEERLDWLRNPKAKGSPAHRVAQLLREFPKNFNALSKADVRAWMKQHGCTDWPHTAPSRTFPDGQPSFTADWLKTHDAGRKIVDIRVLNNLESSFINPLVERHVWNGRVHTTFNQLRGDEYGTVTGRLSSSEPNMQQVPKHEELIGRLFRSAFVPDYGLWGENDYSQIEPRLLAFYTRSKALLDDYRNNPKADAHMAVSRAINRAKLASGQMTEAELKKYRDDIGKRINQTLVTGGGKGVLVQKYKVPEDMVDKAWNDYFRSMPEIRPFQKRAARRMRERGYMVSLLGRRARLEDPTLDYRATNRLLQCGNADIIKDKMVAIDDYLESERKGGKRPDVEMLLNCHDALSFQFDPAQRAVYDRCLAIMADFSSDDALIKLDLPVIVDGGEGPNWAIATYGEEK